MDEDRLKIDEETAQAELDRFLEKARVDKDEPRPEKAQQEFDHACKLFKYHLSKGRITVDDEGWPTVHTEADFLSNVTWSRRPKGSDRCASLEGDKHVSAMYTWVASVTGKPAGTFRKLDDADWDVVVLVHQLFLGHRN